MTYEDFEKFVQERCMYETIYDDSDGRPILVIRLLDAYGMVNKAIAAERERIFCGCGDQIMPDDGAECGTCVTARNAVKQEPLAQMREMLEVQGRDGTWNYDPYSQGMFNGMEFMVALAEGRDPVFREAPERWLHTPPQREWQGLTENEIKHLWYEACQTNLELTSQLIVHLARNIEAKLKEKNT